MSGAQEKQQCFCVVLELILGGNSDILEASL